MDGRQAPDAPITAVVVSWNTRDLLDACLGSMRADAEAGLLRVVVVDNGSADGSRELVGERHPWASLIASDENLGFGGGANLGARGAASPWLLIANADIELRPGSLRRLLGAAEERADAGIAAPRLLSPDGRQQPIFAFPRVGRTVLEMAGMRRFPNRSLHDWIEYGVRWDPARTTSIDWAMGAALLIRREAFESVAGFDPAQWMYAEDLDLAWRLKQAGWGTRYVGEAEVVHAGGASSGQAFSSDEGRFIVTRAYYDWLWRRRGRLVFWAILGVNMAGGLLRRGILALAGRLGSDRARLQHRRWATRTTTDWAAATAARRGA